jgi:hypothetical protein
VTRATGTITRSYNTVAAYKAYYQPISAALNAVLTRSNDTGQVNWAAVTTEPAVTRDYEVFTLTDPTPGGAAPLYMRFDYMGGTTTNSLRLTVGTTTDGAGNLGGLTVPIFDVHRFNPTGGEQRPVYASSDGSYLSLMYGLNAAGTGTDGVGAVVVERTRNADGSPNGLGFSVIRWRGNGAQASEFLGVVNRVYGATSQPADDWTIPCLIPNARLSNSFFSGNTAYAFPTFTWAGGAPQGASKALLIGIDTDFPRGSEIALPHYGGPTRWMPVGSAILAPVPVVATGGTTAAVHTRTAPIFRWD